MLHETLSKPHARSVVRGLGCAHDSAAASVKGQHRPRFASFPPRVPVFPFRSIYLQLESGSVPAPNSATPGPLAGRGSFQPRSPAVRSAAAAAAHRPGAEQRSVPTPTRVVELVSRVFTSSLCQRAYRYVYPIDPVRPWNMLGRTIVNHGRGYTWFRVILRAREALGPNARGSHAVQLATGGGW